MKVCLVASSGGHLKELDFVKKIDMDFQYFIITEKVENKSVLQENIYYVQQINRQDKRVWYKILKIFFIGNRILKKENPDCLISTGALMSVPILLAGKFRKKKIVFIESFARVESASLSGKIVYRFADLFIVYWKNMLKHYPRAIYINLFEED